MREYGKVYTALWRSRKFTRLPSDDARLLYLYLHTCPHGNMVGCFVLPEGYALADLGWQSERYRKAIYSLSEADLVGFDSGENLVRIVDFIKHDPFTNPKHAAGAVKVALSLPDCEQKQLLIEDLRAAKHVKLTENEPQKERLSKGYRNPEPEPEPEPIKNGGGGSAREHAREADPTFRERLLTAIGVDPVSGLTGHGGKQLGTPADMAEAARWLALPGIDEATALAEVARLMISKRDGPPKSFGYFTGAMQRLSGALSAPPLAPTDGGQPRASPPKRLWNINPDDFNPDGTLRQ